MKKYDNPVTKGIAFENAVVSLLNNCGLKAYRTNKTNPSDPEQYKHGFDGGVDIIADFEHHGKTYKQFIFYIQCKCHESDLTKSAISEVYAGMHARCGYGDNSIPVVISTSDASQETRQFAKSLGVELILKAEYKLIADAEYNNALPYSNYGTLMKCLLYHYTHDSIWVDTLPESKSNLSIQSMTEHYIDASKVDFDKAQSYIDKASSLELRATENRQKALDIQRVAVYRALQVANNSTNNHKNNRQSHSQSLPDDSG